MDNTFLTLANVPQDIHTDVALFVEVWHHIRYQNEVGDDKHVH